MPWTIKTYPGAESATLDGHALPVFLEDGPLPVLLVKGVPADYRIEDELGVMPDAFVIISLYGHARDDARIVQLVAYNSGHYAIDFIDNTPQLFESLDALKQRLSAQIQHVKVAAMHLPALWDDMQAVERRIDEEVTTESGRAGYERACYLFGVAAQTDEQVLDAPLPPYGALDALRYPDWNRQEIYEDLIIIARRRVLKNECDSDESA